MINRGEGLRPLLNNPKAAGSAKSTMGLMRHLRFVHDPHYSGFCIRKNSTALMKSGGLFSAAVDMYRKVDPNIKIKLKDQKIVFSSGATVSFSHYENDKAADLYHGLNYQPPYTAKCIE